MARAQTQLERKIRLLRDEKLAFERKRNAAKQSLDAGLNLKNVMALKKNKNQRNPPLKGIGIDKLKTLIEKGLETAVELIEWPGDNEICTNLTKLVNWKRICRRDLDALRQEYDDLEAAVNIKAAALLTEEFFRDIGEDPIGEGGATGEETTTNNNNATTNETRQEVPRQLTTNNNNATRNETRAEAPRQLPMFGEQNDPRGYNSRVISKRSIDSVVATEFLHRKVIMGHLQKRLVCKMWRKKVLPCQW